MLEKKEQGDTLLRSDKIIHYALATVKNTW